MMGFMGSARAVNELTKQMKDINERLKELEERAAGRAERNYNFFQPVGQFIEHVDTINFRMDGDGTFHFENIGTANMDNPAKTASEGGKRVDSESLSRALKGCEAFIWGNAAYSIAFCVCRDLYNLENNASNFERLLAEAGFEIPEGTINAALNRNTWMRLNIEKWERHGAKQRALKLRDEFRRQMDLLGFVAKQAEE